LDASAFHHRDHVHVTWLVLQQCPLPEAIVRVCAGLRRVAASAGKPERYHETITWAFVCLVHDRMVRAEHATWESFAAANADLLTWQPSVLDRYYRPETLASDLARRAFVWPDRLET
jgi:hypothetical protein